jgi:hypothetical protein
MTQRIENPSEAFSNVAKVYLQELENSMAWYEDISQEGAENLLQGHKPYTFLFRACDNENQFIISHVEPDSTISHRAFIFDLSKKNWRYENSTPHIEKKVHKLVHQMMHCDPKVCIPLENGVKDNITALP